MIRTSDAKVNEILDEIAALLDVVREKLPPRLTKEQVALVFGVTPSTTDTWASTGRYPELVYYKSGRSRLYPVTGVARALRATLHRHTGAAA